MNVYEELRAKLVSKDYVLITHPDKSFYVNDINGICLGRVGMDAAEDLFVILQSPWLDYMPNNNPLSIDIDEFWTDPDEFTCYAKTKPQLLDVYLSFSKDPSHMNTMYEERLKYTYSEWESIFIDSKTNDEWDLEEEEEEELVRLREDKRAYNRANPVYDPVTGYNQNGFNRQGYNVYGYDEDGFNKSGLDRDGYNREGFNRDGFDRNGFDEDGFWGGKPYFW